MHWKTKPTINHVDRTAKPFQQNLFDNADDKKVSDRTDNFQPANGNKQEEGGPIEAGKLHLPDAEETAREYCRRRNSGKWSLRKV